MLKCVHQFIATKKSSFLSAVNQADSSNYSKVVVQSGFLHVWHLAQHLVLVNFFSEVFVYIAALNLYFISKQDWV